MLTSDDKEATNPVYVSVGHKIGLDTAVALVTKCSIYRVPEPIRQVRLPSIILSPSHSHPPPSPTFTTLHTHRLTYAQEKSFEKPSKGNKVLVTNM